MYRKLLRYNLRICAGLGSWLIVIPVAATMLVLFAVMAMVSVLRTGSPVVVLEGLGPILLAFASANLLRPEYQYGTLETLLARPVSFRAILTARLLAAALMVTALMAGLGWFMRAVVHLEFNLAMGLLATGASMLFLAAFAVAIAAAWRSPTLGFGVAAALWALDLVLGPRLNPLLTLHGYEVNWVHPGDVWEGWWVGKLLLLGIAALLVVFARRAAARPALQRTFGRWLRTGVSTVLVGLLYIGSGAGWKVEWGARHESALLGRARLWYREAFSVYGPLPVAYLFGPAFAGFIGYRPPWTHLPPHADGEAAAQRLYEEQQLRRIAFGPSTSRWTDNALFELGWHGGTELESTEAQLQGTPTAVAALETLVDEHPASPLTPPALGKLAAFYDTLRRPAEAERALHRLVEGYPRTEAARSAGRRLVDRLVAERRLEEALRVAERLVPDATPDSRPDALTDLGCILARLGRTAEARAKLTEATADAAQAMARLNAREKSPDDIEQVRKIGAARRRALDQLTALQSTGG